jgi:hypothetical protein
VGAEVPAPGRRRHTGRVTRYSAELGEAICARVEAGASLNAICSDLSLPCYRTVTNWRSLFPAFALRYDLARKRQAEARVARGQSPTRGGRWRYTNLLARTICDRMAAGESLLAICAEREMPGYSTVLNWVDRIPEFRAAYARARTLQAHAVADEVLTTVRRDDLIPADKQARIKGLAWYAGKVAPVKYGEKPEAEEEADEGPLIVVTVRNGGSEGTG